MTSEKRDAVRSSLVSSSYNWRVVVLLVVVAASAMVRMDRDVDMDLDRDRGWSRRLVDRNEASFATQRKFRVFKVDCGTSGVNAWCANAATSLILL